MTVLVVGRTIELLHRCEVDDGAVALDHRTGQERQSRVEGIGPQRCGESRSRAGLDLRLVGASTIIDLRSPPYQ